MDETAGDPLIAYRQVNVAGTENLARQAVEHGVRRLVFLSSIKVHGEETAVPYTEQHLAAPQDPYGASKLEAEKILHEISTETGLEVVIIRPPLVYGPGVKANFLNLLKIVERGVPLPLASITNARSLVYLGNLIDAIVTCATHPRAAGQTFLVSDGEDVSTPQLIRQLATALDRPARLLPFPPSLMRLAGKLTGKSMAVDRLLGSLVVDSGKIRRELGWKPPYTMAEGLAETAKWYKDGMARRGHAEKN
jgi:nucleoside-diphosphate-sugar epimerase